VDVLDYLEPAVAKQTVTHLEEMLRPGGVVFAMFHSKKPEGFQRYRVADTSRLQVLSAKPICTAQKVYQNREIQGLFGNCPHHQDLYWPRPVARDTLPQVRPKNHTTNDR